MREQDNGVPVSRIASYTGFPEMLDGRVKTLHPKVHGGLLAVRGDARHEQQAAEHGIAQIDLLVVNLYPFEATVAKGAGFDACIENIDIGGPALIRGAAKNHAAVTVVVDPEDYAGVLDAMRTPLDVFPEFAPPLVEVQVEAPGMSSEAVENLVTIPIESSLKGRPRMTMRSRWCSGEPPPSISRAKRPAAPRVCPMTRRSRRKSAASSLFVE